MPNASKKSEIALTRVRWVVETESTRLNMVARLNFSENALDFQFDYAEQGLAENFRAHF